MTATSSDLAGSPAGFVHEAFLYRGSTEFVDGVVRFVRDGLERDEAVVVAEPRPRLDQLREALADDASAAEFFDMAQIGGNPARIIAVWAAAFDRNRRAGRRLRGVGEPAYPGRSAAEFAECELHELLLDRAFGGGPGWRLLCPYDQERLPPSVSAKALLTHPYRSGPAGPVATDGAPRATAEEALAAALPGPADVVLRGAYREGDVPAVRRTVAQYARSCGLPATTVEALELAASELASNSIRHGGGGGSLAMWLEPAAVVVEFSDAGVLADPLVGRRRPPPDQPGGRGLYLVNELCDLVQVRSSTAGTTVRILTWR